LDKNNAYRLGQWLQHRYYDPRYFALEHLWIAYDAIYLAQTECLLACALAEFMAGKPLNATSCSELESPQNDVSLNDAEELSSLLSATQWDELQSLVHQVELLKYATPGAGRRLGTNLLLQIMARIETSGLVTSLVLLQLLLQRLLLPLLLLPYPLLPLLLLLLLQQLLPHLLLLLFNATVTIAAASAPTTALTICGCWYRYC
jgi:hypothetical protein